MFRRVLHEGHQHAVDHAVGRNAVGHAGSFAGHVYPGIFFLMFAALLFVERDNGPFKRTMGFFLAGVSIAGILIEAIGGFVTFDDLLFQYAHESCYVGYLVAGTVCFLEASGVLIEDTWRVALSLAFLMEAYVMYGHSEHQSGTIEESLHLLLAHQGVAMSVFAASGVFLSDERLSQISRGLLAGCAVWKAIWFFFIAHVVYSGVYGPDGVDYPSHDLNGTAAVTAVLAETLVVSFFFKRKHNK